MPGKPWGIRSIPEIDSRYPLWDQENLVRDIDEGRFYLPDAEEGRRETIVTTVIDAKPIQCQRLPGPSFVPLVGAFTLGGFFIFGTFHAWWLALLSVVVAIGVFCYWLWTGTADHPEKDEKDIGLGLKLPLYVSGSASVGWWAVFVTMLADITAYVCIVFGYFFFWTVRPDFPPRPAAGPGVFWPALGAALLVAAWLLVLMARRWNAEDRAARFYVGLGVGTLFAAGGALALVMGPWRTGLVPSAHAYPATVWLLVCWTVLHVAVGVLMNVFCLVSRLAGRMTARRDMDIHNVALYWHFALLTAVTTSLVIAGFPLVA
jgi:cytochrome c oxidase subunit I+III